MSADMFAEAGSDSNEDEEQSTQEIAVPSLSQDIPLTSSQENISASTETQEISVPSTSQPIPLTSSQESISASSEVPPSLSSDSRRPSFE